MTELHTSELAGSVPPSALLEAAQQAVPSFLSVLEQLVSIDSGSTDPDGVREVAQACAPHLRDRGFQVDEVACDPSGPALLARRSARGVGGAHILLLAHMDTVFGPGEAERRPFRIARDAAYGPGVCDDKAGICAAIAVVDVLDHVTPDDCPALSILLTPDEEIGSPHSRWLVEQTALGCDAVLALEAARVNGDIVSARRGVADAVITVTGRAAHAGIEPERGVSSTLAAARLVMQLHELNGRWPDVTVNVGVVRGGTQANVVAAQTRVEVDVRGGSPDAFADVRRAVEQLVGAPLQAGAEATLSWREVTPPMERTPAVAQLVGLAREVAAGCGVVLHDAATGGAGDANHAASLGVPTLDGLAPVGGNDHSVDEFLDIASIAPRVAILAGLIRVLGQGGAEVLPGAFRRPPSPGGSTR